VHSEHQAVDGTNLPQFRKIAKVALYVALLNFVVLSMLVLTIDKPQGDYLSMLNSLTQSRENLPMVMALVALILISATALTTYFIVLYSSFRVAGPLYRFSCNLRSGLKSAQPWRLLNIRKGDDFQQESQLMLLSMKRLLSHYQLLASTARELELLLTQEQLDAELIALKIVQLQELAQRVTA
jgi:hypothetical protein